MLVVKIPHLIRFAYAPQRQVGKASVNGNGDETLMLDDDDDMAPAEDFIPMKNSEGFASSNTSRRCYAVVLLQ